MEYSNTAVMVLCSHDTLGRITPHRVVYKLNDTEEKVIKLTGIISQKNTKLAGIKATIYTCTFMADDMEWEITLKFDIDDSTWYLLRIEKRTI